MFFIAILYEVHVMIIVKRCDTSSYLVNLVHVDEILFFHGHVYINCSQFLYLEKYVNVMQRYVILFQFLYAAHHRVEFPPEVH